MTFYPEKISARFYAPKNAGKLPPESACGGTGASFVCGSLVRFSLEIDAETKEIKQARFASNGCGFAVAAADALAEKITGQKLTALHGLDDAELTAGIENELGRFPAHRAHCTPIGIEALRGAFADFRARQLEEFAGEKALVCTCFGVSEERIEQIIAETGAETVEQVGARCRAGTGCGACQFLIGELLDVYGREF